MAWRNRALIRPLAVLDVHAKVHDQMNELNKERITEIDCVGIFVQRSSAECGRRWQPAAPATARTHEVRNVEDRSLPVMASCSPCCRHRRSSQSLETTTLTRLTMGLPRSGSNTTAGPALPSPPSNQVWSHRQAGSRGPWALHESWHHGLQRSVCSNQHCPRLVERRVHLRQDKTRDYICSSQPG